MVRIPTYSLDQEQQDISEETQKRKAEGSQTIKAKKQKQEPEAADGGVNSDDPEVKIGKPGLKRIALAVKKLEETILDVQGKIAAIAAPDMNQIVPGFFTTKLNTVLRELQKLKDAWKDKGQDDKAKKSEVTNLPAAATELCQRADALATQVQGIMDSAAEDF